MSAVRGRDLQVGDVLVVLGAEHPVDRLVPLDGPPGAPTTARVAYDPSGWSTTVLDADMVELAARTAEAC